MLARIGEFRQICVDMQNAQITTVGSHFWRPGESGVPPKAEPAIHSIRILLASFLNYHASAPSVRTDFKSSNFYNIKRTRDILLRVEIVFRPR
jgi:hypothetical protein